MTSTPGSARRRLTTSAGDPITTASGARTLSTMKAGTGCWLSGSCPRLRRVMCYSREEAGALLATLRRSVLVMQRFCEASLTGAAPDRSDPQFHHHQPRLPRLQHDPPRPAGQVHGVGYTSIRLDAERLTVRRR